MAIKDPSSGNLVELNTNQGSGPGSKEIDSLDYNNSNLSSHRVYKTKCLIQDFENKTQFDGNILLEGPKYKWIPGNLIFLFSSPNLPPTS
jgi:hypothetical protein